MNPTIPLVAFAAFLAGLVFHVLHWRLKRPAKTELALAADFLAFPAALLILAPALTPLLTPAEAASAYLLHFLISGAYIASFPAVQAQSPSLEILLLFGKTGGAGFAGLSREEILKSFDASSLVSCRIGDLMKSGLVSRSGGTFTLTSPGRFVALFFRVQRRLLGLAARGG